jgi:hypothetical protein
MQAYACARFAVHDSEINVHNAEILSCKLSKRPFTLPEMAVHVRPKYPPKIKWPICAENVLAPLRRKPIGLYVVKNDTRAWLLPTKTN